MRLDPASSAVAAWALTGCVVLGTPATATADCECWHYVRAEGATANTTFSEVSAPSFNSALAAGNRGSEPLVAHWNGVRWREAPAVPLPAGTVVEGVSASSTQDAWAVGYTPDGTPQTARWSGADGGGRWNAVPIPASEPSYPRAVHARSADDAWIVGGAGRPVRRAMAWHWDGGAWRPVRGPAAPDIGPGWSSEFVAVSALAADDVWAVGVHGSADEDADDEPGDRGSTRALVAHWDGRTWSEVPLPGPADVSGQSAPPGSLLSDVAALAPDDVWVVGTAWRDGALPLARHWNGRHWENVPVPGMRGCLYSVASDGEGGVWTAGETADGTALLAHWNGERWDVSGAPTPGDPSPGEGLTKERGAGAVWGLAQAPGTSYLWAVGAYARPGPDEPVRYLLTWTNAPRHR